MFQWNNNDLALSVILVTHADDFLYSGTLNWYKNVVEKLLCIFKINKREKESFRYVGLNIVQTSKESFVDQNSYFGSLKSVEFSTERASQKDEELTIEKRQN